MHHGRMAGKRDPDDLDALLAEVERSLSPGGQAPAARRAAPTPSGRGEAEATSPGRLARARADAGRAVVVSALLAAVIGVGFLLLPFVGIYGAGCAAGGAFVAAYVSAVLARWR